jgi:hypothetical protein
LKKWLAIPLLWQPARCRHGTEPWIDALLAPACRSLPAAETVTIEKGAGDSAFVAACPLPTRNRTVGRCVPRVFCRSLPAAETVRNACPFWLGRRSRLIDFTFAIGGCDLTCAIAETGEDRSKERFPVVFFPLAAFPPSERGDLVRRLLSLCLKNTTKRHLFEESNSEYQYINIDIIISITQQHKDLLSLRLREK